MNQFVALCNLASTENWCWNLFCTTCGHMHFRYAFAELTEGKSPADPEWLIHRRKTRYSDRLGPLPRRYTEEQKEIMQKICREADLSEIASSCRFPDWLGYLGLVLQHTYSDSESFKALSSQWASQLADLVSSDALVHAQLMKISYGDGLLNINDLEAYESTIMHNKAMESGA